MADTPVNPGHSLPGTTMDVSVPVSPNIEEVLRPKPKNLWESLTDPNDNIIFVFSRNLMGLAIIGTFCYLMVTSDTPDKLPVGLKEVVLIVLGTFIGNRGK